LADSEALSLLGSYVLLCIDAPYTPVYRTFSGNMTRLVYWFVVCSITVLLLLHSMDPRGC